MTRRDGDLLFAGALTMLGVLVAITGIGAPIAPAMLGLPLALALPGYAVSAALFPPQRLGLTERLTLSFGISLATLAMAGLILNWTPWGLKTASWALLLSCTTLIALAIARIRRPRQSHPSLLPKIRISLAQLAILVIAAALLLLAMVSAWGSAVAPRGSGFTNFSMVATGNRDEVRIGITSMERSTTGYVVELDSGSRVLETWTVSHLAPQQSWTATYSVTAAPAGTTLEAHLFRIGGTDAPYRDVFLRGLK
jgi:uncharacterized membrane protein